MEHKLITGKASDRNVFIDGVMLMADRSLAHRNHSPDGFAWGYGGSGPSQLALAILLELYGENIAQRFYMRFKFDIIAALPMQEDFELEVARVQEWLDKRLHGPESGCPVDNCPACAKESEKIS